MICKDTLRRNIATIDDKEFLIIGAGGIGSHMAVLLTQLGAKTVCVFDYDKLEHHNLSRTYYGANHVGWFKTSALEHLCINTSVNASINRSMLDIVKKRSSTDVEDVNDATERMLAIRSRTNNSTYSIKTKLLMHSRSVGPMDLAEMKDSGFIIIETIDKYFGPDEMLHKELVDWKLNYDNTWMTVTSNPYAVKQVGTDGETDVYKMPLDVLSAGGGYTITPSFLLTPEILCHMLMYRMAANNWVVEGTRQWFSELTRLTNGIMKEAV